MGTVKVANGMLSVDQGSIHLTKICGNFDPKLNGSVRSNRKSFDIIGPPFEVDHFSRSDRSEFWMNGLDRAHCDVSLPGLLASDCMRFPIEILRESWSEQTKKMDEEGGEVGKEETFPSSPPLIFFFFFSTEKCHVE